MSDKKDLSPRNEIDFTTSPSFKKTTRRSKWKQILLYIIITCITATGLIIFIHLGTQYLISNKLEELDQKTIQSMKKNGLSQGAGITSSKIRYNHDIFSVMAKKTIFKEIGDRRIVWDTSMTKIPAIGDVEIIDRGSGMSESYSIGANEKRVIRYNELNNERYIDFYYPTIDYDYLSQELSIAIGLEENKLIEVALSFKKPVTLSKLGDTLGVKNVDWLWVNRKSPEEMERLDSKWEEDKWKLKRGEDAYGFSVSAEHPYTEYPTDITISGAVISGTPKELARFQGMEIIRASVLGVTIDKY
ncbi:hypothetical protein ACFO3D_13765 [Virgibacillus kekensis]|uniref:Sigma factor regulator C-terminal domain-containing protein n=1 Tax=Virgibacillus kekensis TaxID=202261 RepID=A0ABV9DKB6_9BACI